MVKDMIVAAAAVAAAAMAPLAATVKPILTHINDNSMAISWGYLTPSDTLPSSLRSRVRYGFAANNLTETVTSTPTMMTSPTENMTGYDYCGHDYEHHILHHVQLKNLPTPETIYYCADEIASSSKLETCGSFKTSTPSSSAELRFYATADVGDPVSHSWTAIPQMSKQCQVDDLYPIDVSLGFHVGDIAYNLDIPQRGDDYIAGVSSNMGSQFPWMFAPGNHEADCNYTYQNYKGRFAAQNFTSATHGVPSKSSRWYSFDKGPVHFVAIDTDAWGFDEVAYILKQQYDWLTQDLEAVDKSITPWIVLMGHRPMYCSSASAIVQSHLGWPKQHDDMPKGTPAPDNYGDEFRKHGFHPPSWSELELLSSDNDGDNNYPCGIADLLRNGMIHADGSGDRSYGLETLMQQYQVNVYLTGHEHNYERTWPIMNGTQVNSYDQPGKPVHIVTGSGGAYGKDPFGPVAPFDAYRSSDWSYSDIFVNNSHFILNQRLANDSSVIDTMVLTR